MKRIIATCLFLVSLTIAVVAGIAAYEWLSQYIHRGFSASLGIFVFVGTHWLLNIKVFNRPSEKNTPVLKVGENEMKISYPNGESDDIAISDITKIEIVTTDEGPWNEDLWWVFSSKNKDEPFCAPQMSLGNEKIFNLLESRFSFVDMKAIQKAMGATSNARFEVWSSSQSGAVSR